MTEHFDAIIVGAGQAGPFLASRLTAAGMSVAFVERKLFGGTCVNTGCTPTKAMVASAYAAQIARRASEYGVAFDGPIRVDMRRVKARKDEIVGKSRAGVEKWLRGMSKLKLFQGHARFESTHELSVGSDRIAAARIFLNVGGRANIPDMPGLDRIVYFTYSGLLDIDFAPPHLIVIGGSYVGLEFAQMFRRFGSEVTVVEMSPRLIHREDEDVSAAIREILEAEGIRIRCNAKCISFDRRGSETIAAVDCTSGDPAIAGTHVLLAVGRRPNTDDLGLDKAGIAVDKHGYIPVDDQLRTSVPGIWAIGDCNGRGAFTHTSWNDAEIVAANILDNDPRRVTDRIPCYGLFIDPPLGRVGLTEAEVRRSGRSALVGKRPMTRVSRAIEKGETQGFMKIVVDTATREILGASILGPGGDEAVHSVLDAMYAKASDSIVRRAVHIHPTVAELIPTVLGELAPLE